MKGKVYYLEKIEMTFSQYMLYKKSIQFFGYFDEFWFLTALSDDDVLDE